MDKGVKLSCNTKISYCFYILGEYYIGEENYIFGYNVMIEYRLSLVILLQHTK